MNKKNAFTLAEIIVALCIVGIITALAVYSVQRYDKGIRYLYSNTYHSLDRALYNASQYTDKPNPFLKEEYNENGETVEVSPQVGAERLCNYFVAYLNTVSSTCSVDGLATVYIQDITTPAEYADNLGTPKFVLANGVTVFISPRIDAREGHSEDKPFFMVYADINGVDNKPNSFKYEPPGAGNNNRPVDPDLFAFAALDIGRICPLGPPEIDPRYMQTRIAYQTILETDDADIKTPATVRYTTVSKPYVFSKAEAWGYYLGDKNSRDQIYADDEPTTYNDHIRSRLGKNSPIYSYVLGQEDTQNTPIDLSQFGVQTRTGAVKDGGLGCIDMNKTQEHLPSTEECWVIIDRYIY